MLISFSNYKYIVAYTVNKKLQIAEANCLLADRN